MRIILEIQQALFMNMICNWDDVVLFIYLVCNFTSVAPELWLLRLEITVVNVCKNNTINYNK